MDCLPGSLPIKYLGFNLGSRPTRASFWEPVIQNFKNSLALWKSKTLTFAGCIVLINSILAALPIFYMTLFKASKKVCAELKAWQRCFLWHNSVARRVLCKVNWNTVCRPKKEGGLGIRRLNVVNASLLAKWFWRFSDESYSLWKKVLC